MRKIFIVTGMYFLLISYSTGQSYFNKLFDEEVGILYRYNHFELVEDQILVNTGIYQFNEEEQIYYPSLGWTYLDFEGNISQCFVIDSIDGDNIYFQVEDNFIIFGDTIYGFVKSLGIEDWSFSNYLFKSDLQFNDISTIEFLPERENAKFLTNLKTLKHDNQLITYGEFYDYDDSIDVANIHIWNDPIDSVERNIEVQSMHGRNPCFDLHPLEDGQFAYISVSGRSEDSVIINKIDSNGVILKQKVFEDDNFNNTYDNPSLLASSTGDYYVFLEEYGIPWQEPVGGSMVKVSADLETVEWELEFPLYPVSYYHSYRVEDIIETNNGDIVVCGYIFADYSNDDSHYTGFISRFSKDGETLWNRYYRIPRPVIPEGQAPFKYSYLFQIEETEVGGFIAAGHTWKVVPDSIYAIKQLWVLSVDENGCLPGEECQELITLDSQLIYDQKPIFPIGTKWTYEYIDTTSPTTILHSYITFELTDTLYMNEKLVYRMENNRSEDGWPVEYMYQDDDKRQIWFWDEALQDFQLTYDFDVPKFTSYHTQWVDTCDTSGNPLINEIELDLDTISWYKWLDCYGFHMYKQEVALPDSIYNQGMYNVLMPIGKMHGGLRLRLGKVECDPDRPKIGKLLCFEKDSCVDDIDAHSPGWVYPPVCDSVWVEIIDAVEEPDMSEFKVYPNPVSEQLTIELPDGGIYNIQIMDVMGRRVADITDKHDIAVIDTQEWIPGVYFMVAIENNEIQFESKLILTK